MFDIAWTEMLLIAVVTVLVVGPKDLPRVLRAVGKAIGKARTLASRFQSDMDALAREAELEEIRKEARLYQARLMDPKGEVARMLDPTSGTASPASARTSDDSASMPKAAEPEQEASRADPPETESESGRG